MTPYDSNWCGNALAILGTHCDCERITCACGNIRCAKPKHLAMLNKHCTCDAIKQADFAKGIATKSRYDTHDASTIGLVCCTCETIASCLPPNHLARQHHIDKQNLMGVLSVSSH